MKNFIKFRNSTFSVSNSVITTIAKNNLNFHIINYKGKKVHILDDSSLLSFTIVPKTSSIRFYIKIQNSAKLRVNKFFYDFLVMCSEQHNAEKTQNSEILMLSSLNTSNNDKIITTPLS